jgi:ABC-2 type transport system permease protein
MNRLATTEARLLVRDWTVLVFAFVFPPFTMLILAGVFGTQPDDGYAMRRPDDYYVAASIGVPIIALALVGLPVAIASYRERGVLQRFEAFGISRGKVVSAQALVTCGLVALGAVVVLALAAPTYGIPHVVHPLQTALGVVAGTVTLALIGVAIGLAVRTARAAQAVGLLGFFPLYLLGGGGPPRGAMTGPMRTIADALPSPIGAITDPWLGTSGQGARLAALAGWAAVALVAIVWLARRRES